MRYHYDKPNVCLPLYGRRYICDHLIYNSCTLFAVGDLGLAVIQQRFDSDMKSTWWSEIDLWLANDLYLHPKFFAYFQERAGLPQHGLYPTVTIRQIMWALKMKPLKKELWETVFDRRTI